MSTKGQKWLELRNKADGALNNFVNEGGFDFDEISKGEFIEVPIACLTPNTVDEWEDAEAGASQTNGPIFVAAERGGIIIKDGHNRVKDAIFNNKDNIKAYVENSNYL